MLVDLPIVGHRHLSAVIQRRRLMLPASSPCDNWPERGKAEVNVKLDGKHYKVLKDNYPYKSTTEYRFSHAVKVNAETGEVTPPEQSRRRSRFDCHARRGLSSPGGC